MKVFENTCKYLSDENDWDILDSRLLIKKRVPKKVRGWILADKEFARVELAKLLGKDLENFAVSFFDNNVYLDNKITGEPLYFVYLGAK